MDPAPPATGRLETTATILGIAVALPAIAGLFFPGVGIKHHPPAQATMAVREVQARVTRGEFVRRAIRERNARGSAVRIGARWGTWCGWSSPSRASAATT